MTARESIDDYLSPVLTAAGRKPIGALLDDYRLECRREAAREQRAALLREGYSMDCRCDGCTPCLVRYAIIAIDPDGDYYEDDE